jgi:hypothetical protein
MDPVSLMSRTQLATSIVSLGNGHDKASAVPGIRGLLTRFGW